MSDSVLLVISLLLVIGNFHDTRFFVYGVVDEYKRDDFPDDFVFGSGTSAYQVEGAVLEDGRSFSIWDTFAHNPGVTWYNGANADITCDGYHKYKKDIQLMVETGLEAYRFSISWSRLIPNGRGSVNVKGLQYYNDFINILIAHGIQPHVTLHHFDLPQVLEDEYGGWISRKSVKDFVAYADVCFREFGDRVLHWTTFNEANIFSLSGYDFAFSPPGRCSSPFGMINCSRGDSTSEPYLVTHYLLLAHASAVKLYRQKYKAMQRGFVGINLLGFWFEPYTNTTKDVKAAQRDNAECYIHVNQKVSMSTGFKTCADHNRVPPPTTSGDLSSCRRSLSKQPHRPPSRLYETILAVYPFLLLGFSFFFASTHIYILKPSSSFIFSNILPQELTCVVVFFSSNNNTGAPD
ncbi:hypothetical protein LXL04_036419 [Taraxacum kok-saghyz]